MEWLVGPADRVACHAACLSLKSLSVEDTAHLLTRHGALMGVFAFNQHQYVADTTQTVVCERGVARFELMAHRWRWADTPGAQWRDEPPQIDDRDHWFRTQAHHWLDAVEGKSDVLCSLHDARATLATTKAALRSAATGAAWVDTPRAPAAGSSRPQ